MMGQKEATLEQQEDHWPIGKEASIQKREEAEQRKLEGRAPKEFEKMIDKHGNLILARDKGSRKIPPKPFSRKPVPLPPGVPAADKSRRRQAPSPVEGDSRA